jgi:hypothetical protein
MPTPGSRCTRTWHNGICLRSRRREMHRIELLPKEIGTRAVQMAEGFTRSLCNVMYALSLTRLLRSSTMFM